MTGTPSDPNLSLKGAVTPSGPGFRCSVRWTMLLGVHEALGMLEDAIDEVDFQPGSLGSGAVVVNVPRSLRKMRRASILTAKVSSAGGVTEITWAVAGQDDIRHVHLDLLEEHLPDGALFDHGIHDAARRAGITSLDKKDVRCLSAELHGMERVQAIGTGVFGGERGMASLTDRRLLFHGHCTHGRALIDSPLDSIGSMTLGKKTSGETLTAELAGTTAVITNLGHGEGHGIARTFRETRENLRPPENVAR